jgi:serine protease inhibitor
VTVTLNRPFMLAVVDESGAILFLGQINDPAAPGG